MGVKTWTRQYALCNTRRPLSYKLTSGAQGMGGHTDDKASDLGLGGVSDVGGNIV